MKGASRAFSLTEVVVALGVATVAIVSILALFPVGFDTSRESAAETEAAVLARSIVSDLVSGARARGFTNAILLKGNNPLSATDYEGINLTLARTQAVAYKYEAHQFDFKSDEYRPLALKAAGLLNSASNPVTWADFVASVAIQPVPSLGGALAQVTIQISAPASVALSNRTMRTTYQVLLGP